MSVKYDWKSDEDSAADQYETVKGHLRRKGILNKILDIGCGTGSLLEKIRKDHSCIPIGIDLSTEGLSYAQNKNITVLHTDADGRDLHFLVLFIIF